MLKNQTLNTDPLGQEKSSANGQLDSQRGGRLAAQGANSSEGAERPVLLEDAGSNPASPQPNTGKTKFERGLKWH